MLTKLLKHEFRATGRIMLPLYLILLATAAGANLSIRMMESRSVFLNILAALITLAYVVAIMGVCVVNFILMLQRFYKNLLGDEGYLMFTLPASVHQHLWAKLIAAAVWFIATGIVVFLSFFVVAFDVRFFTDLAEIFPALFRELNAYYAINGTAVLLELLALLFVGSVGFMLQFYAALAAGHSFANHKTALSVLFFFVFQFVVQMAGLLCLEFLDTGLLAHLLSGLNFHVDGVATVHIGMLFLIAVAAVYGAVFYVVTTYFLKNRLNLE